MKIIIENTNQLTQIEARHGDCRCAVPGRIWKGKTESGVEVQCVITRIAVPNDAELSQFERELESCNAPVPLELAFPLRMVL